MSLLKDLKLKGRVLYSEPLSRHTTFKIGGPVRIWAEPRDIDDIGSLLEISKSKNIPIFLIGGGSNLLASDGDLDMIAVSLKDSFGSFRISKNGVFCGAGCNLQRFILATLEAGYSGLEFMAGIPGTVGGAIKMNAGAGLTGPWISSFLSRLRVMDLDGTLKYLEKKDLRFGYRESGIGEVIILEAEFDLKAPSLKETALKEYNRFLEEKKNKQELSVPSAGCVFRNPKNSKLSAAALIEESGFKGKRIGDAAVSTKHANFIVNTKKATFKDVADLIELIKEKVSEKYNIYLEAEIEILK